MRYPVARTASRDEDAGRYQRHRPEQTLLHRIVDEYYPAFTAHLAELGRELPGCAATLAARQCRKSGYH